MYYTWDSTNQKSKLQLINNNIEDYFDIDNFFEKIRIRQFFLNSFQSIEDRKANENELKKINKETLEVCEHCLFAVDWTKYK